jgi:hypothetical protein
MEMMFKAGLRKEAIKYIIDDRESVCAVWRELDLPLIQVKEDHIIATHPSIWGQIPAIGIPQSSEDLTPVK